VAYIKKKRLPLEEKIVIWIRNYTKYGRPQLLHVKENNDSDYLFITDKGNNASHLSFNRRLRFLQKKITDKKLRKKRITTSVLLKSGIINNNTRKIVSIADQIKYSIM
jgi:site-specific recombinase XerD